MVEKSPMYTVPRKNDELKWEGTLPELRNLIWKFLSLLLFSVFWLCGWILILARN
jgi:hypothetical protein